MNLVPLVVPVTLSMFFALSGRTRHVSLDGADTFRYSPALACLIAFCSLLYACAPLLPRVVDPKDPWFYYFFYGASAAAAMLFAVYLWRYRIVVTSDAITAGAFWHRQFLLSDVVRLQLNSQANQCLLRFRAGKRLRLSGLLGDFDALVRLLRSRCSESAYVGP
jgi:hypothetical protein